MFCWWIFCFLNGFLYHMVNHLGGGSFFLSKWMFVAYGILHQHFLAQNHFGRRSLAHFFLAFFRKFSGMAMEIWLSVASNCFEKVAVNCTCFCINGHDFSARTMAERKLWLRAISNMKAGRYLPLTGVLMCEGMGVIAPMFVCRFFTSRHVVQPRFRAGTKIIIILRRSLRL